MLYYRSLLIYTNKEFMIDSSQNVSKSDHSLAKQILFVAILQYLHNGYLQIIMLFIQHIIHGDYTVRMLKYYL